MKALTKPTNVRLIAAVASLILVSALIVRTTQAAFSDTETNAGNSFASGQLELSTTVTAPMFAPGGTGYTVNTAAMNGGASKSNCIAMTYASDFGVATPVTLAASQAAAGTGLDGYLTVSITRYASSDCSGTGTAVKSDTVANLLAAAPFSTGWSPTSAGAAVSFGFVVVLTDDNAAQNLTSSTVDFTWTAQS